MGEGLPGASAPSWALRARPRVCELATGSAGSERAGFAKALLPNWILIKESQWPFMFQWYLLGNSLFVAAPRTLAPHWGEGSDWQVRGVASLWDHSLVSIPHQHLIEDASQSLSSPSPAPCTDLRAWPCPRPATQMCPSLSFPGDWAPPFLSQGDQKKSQVLGDRMEVIQRGWVCVGSRSLCFSRR